jgi:hypothetical protein
MADSVIRFPVTRARQISPATKGEEVGEDVASLGGGLKTTLLAKITGDGPAAVQIRAAENIQQLGEIVLDQLPSLFENPEYSALVVKNRAGEFELVRALNISEGSLGINNPDSLFRDVMQRGTPRIVEPDSRWPIVSKTGAKFIAMSPIILRLTGEFLGVLVVGRDKMWSKSAEKDLWIVLREYAYEAIAPKVIDLLRPESGGLE